MDKEKWALLAVVLAALAVMRLGVLQGIDLRSPSEPIVIGALLPLSGSTAAYGEGARKAIELALTEINDAGGITGRRVRVVYENTGADPERGLAAFESITASRTISAVIGPMSSPVALAVAPRAQALGIVLLSPSASTPELTTAGDLVFRDCLSDAYEGSILANLALNGLTAQTAGILWIDNAYGRGLADVFTKSYATYGGALVASVAYAPETTDFAEPIS